MRVLVADPLADAGVAALSAQHDVDVKTGLSKDELLAVIGDYDGVVVRSQTTIDADIIEAGTALKVIARAGVGLDNVDVDAATRAGVIVCNAPQSNIISAAEHTMALILALARNVPQAHEALRQGRWERNKWKGAELHDKVLGVLGLGRIGTLVAQRASAFGMRLVAFDPFVSPDRAARMGVRLLDTVEEVLGEADVITIHMPRTAETTGLLNAERLALCKPTARIVNVARGGIVDEQALADACANGVIAGAAIDVFAEEPTTSSPLFDLPNVVVTPHLGASTEEAQDKAGVQVAEALNLALAGEFVPTAVNVQGGPVPDDVKPYLGLAERLGRLLVTLADGASGEITVEFLGDLAQQDCRIVGLAVLRGMLSAVVAEPVTFVNAPLLGADRGLSLREIADTTRGNFASLVRVSGTDRRGDVVAVAGTVVQPGDRERLTEVWGTPIDIETQRHMAFFRYDDRPGIIGAVGQALGDAGVNIGSAQVGRSKAGGEALMALGLDEEVPADLMQRLVETIGAHDGRSVSLDLG
ncbi:MAG: phosphoglycerate dehydrogenase [Nitriliruptorales bacterium]|nr:phosphoglycerate dehydrogenase [Nitriliruptorales bacterium]